jgi:hypothetical protein
VDDWVHSRDEENGEQEADKPGLRRRRAQPQKRASASR